MELQQLSNPFLTRGNQVDLLNHITDQQKNWNDHDAKSAMKHKCAEQHTEMHMSCAPLECLVKTLFDLSARRVVVRMSIGS